MISKYHEICALRHANFQAYGWEEYAIIDFLNLVGWNEVRFRKTVGLRAGLRIILKNGRFMVE